MLERSKDYSPLFAFMGHMKHSYRAIKLLRKKIMKEMQTESMNLLSGQHGRKGYITVLSSIKNRL